MPGAARVGDNHVCPSPTPAPHGGGPVGPAGSPMVMTNGMSQARAADPLTCAAPVPNFIVTGARTVLVDGQPAARVSDKTMHPPPGQIVVGSPDVLIGGPTVGAVLGDPYKGKDACFAAAKSRSPASSQQSYENCGVESARQIINQVNGSNIDEDTMLDAAMRDGDAERDRRRMDSGATKPTQRRDLLARHGIESTLEPNSMANITQAVAERRGVITSHDVKVLWDVKNSGGHAVFVTGLRYSQDGSLLGVTINDTGQGPCSRTVPAAQFEKSLLRGVDVNVTKKPIW